MHPTQHSTRIPTAIVLAALVALGSAAVAAHAQTPSYALQRGSKLIGKSIQNPSGENLGEINDLAVDLGSGETPYAVLSFGGVLGIGDKLFAMPLSVVKLDHDKDIAIINVPKERLKEAPGFDAKHWPDLTDEDLGTSVNKFYGVDAVVRQWEQLRSSGGWGPDSEYNRLYNTRAGVQTVKGSITRIENQSPLPRMTPATIVTIDTGDGKTQIVHLGPAWFIDNQPSKFERGDQVTVQGVSAKVDGKPVILVTEIRRGDDVLMVRDAKTGAPLWISGTTHSPGSENPTPRGRIVRASEIIKMKVVSASDENLGDVQDLVIDIERGRIAYAVLAFGGWMGINEKFFAVPWQSFTLNRNENNFVLNVDKERLKGAPGFDKKHWPELADTTWAKESSEYYGVPYGNQPAARETDNRAPRGWEKGDPYLKNYDIKKVETIKGTIVGVERGAPIEGMSDGVILKIEHDGKTIPVHLGPAWYIDRQDLPLNNGDQVKVTGAKVVFEKGGEAIIATEIEVNDATLRLRDKDGTPRWSGWRSGARPHD